MEKCGLVIRQRDPFDGRRIFVSLAPEVSAAVRKWFADGFGEAA
jgi:DNA-binding MarR family transcriptional regulator